MGHDDLIGGNALITGGGSGIGLACARRLLRHAAAVTIASRSEQRLRAAAATLRAEAPEGAEVRWAVCDVADEGAVEAAVATADEGDGLRVVVAGAGTGWVAPLASIPLAAWQRVLDTTLTGTFLVLKHAAARMAAAGGGAFTAISSVNAVLTSRFHTPYCAAKAGVDMLVRTAADELGPAGIRVNAVQPGLVPTDLSAGLVADDRIRGDFLDQMPISRLGTVDEIASAVAFLSSPAASWITGVCLPVDGGQHLRRGERFDGWVARDHPDAPVWWGVGPTAAAAE